MPRKVRVLIAVVVIELLLGGLWLHLAQVQASQHNPDVVDAQATIGSTMGAAMGAFLGFGLLMLFVAAKRDRASRRDDD